MFLAPLAAISRNFQKCLYILRREIFHLFLKIVLKIVPCFCSRSKWSMTNRRKRRLRIEISKPYTASYWKFQNFYPNIYTFGFWRTLYHTRIAKNHKKGYLLDTNFFCDIWNRNYDSRSGGGIFLFSSPLSTLFELHGKK